MSDKRERDRLALRAASLQYLAAMDGLGGKDAQTIGVILADVQHLMSTVMVTLAWYAELNLGADAVNVATGLMESMTQRSHEGAIASIIKFRELHNKKSV